MDLVLEASDIVSLWSLCSFSNLTRLSLWYSVSTGMSCGNWKDEQRRDEFFFTFILR